MVKTIIVATILFSSPVFAFESTNEGVDFFNEALKNVKEYHLQQTRTQRPRTSP